MPINVRVGDAVKEMKSLSVMAGGELKRVKSVYSWVGDEEEGEWRLVWRAVQPLSLTADFTAILHATNFPNVIWQQLTLPHPNGVTITPIGGEGPFGYYWSTTGKATATRPSSASTLITARVNRGETVSGTLTCVCTDAAGTSASISIPYSLKV